jgi:hypothetical protein
VLMLPPAPDATHSEPDSLVPGPHEVDELHACVAGSTKRDATRAATKHRRFRADRGMAGALGRVEGRRGGRERTRPYGAPAQSGVHLRLIRRARRASRGCPRWAPPARDRKRTRRGAGAVQPLSVPRRPSDRPAAGRAAEPYATANP